jgi:(1->4)-alpha-D-glucan 1-alpha-D-glucosylmutase
MRLSKDMYAPISAYRIHLSNDITFRRAADAISYLKELGIDALSVSSPFHSVQINERGLATIDPTRLDVELGAESGFAELNSELARSDMHLILDLNPSQMPAFHENAWWFDVLEWGRQSQYAGHFDVDWTKPIALPVLDRPIDQAVQAGNLQLIFDRVNASLGISCGDQFYPFAPDSYRAVFQATENKTAASLVKAANNATSNAASDFHSDLLKIFDQADITDQLDIASWLSNISHDADHIIELMSLQNWSLLEAEGAPKRLNYGNAADLKLTVGLRIEDPGVFADFHDTSLLLLAKTQVKGFRVNEIDELADPAEYTKQLRRQVGEETFLVTDKILLEGERYPDDWQVNGTAGYEFIATVANLFVDHAGFSKLQDSYQAEFEPNSELPGQYAHAKAVILHEEFADELERLAELLIELESPHAEKLLLRRAIAELVAELPIYRTYSNAGPYSRFYLNVLRSTVSRISERNGQSVDERETLAFILRILSSASGSSNAEIAKVFTVRFQQLTAAVMAQALQKSYIYARYPIALDELMLSPTEASNPIETFHETMRQKAAAAPSGMLATSFSYATKFGEDARMRLLALSEASDVWISAVKRWRERHADYVTTIEEAVAPDPKTEWLIYQTLAAIWPVALSARDDAGVASVRAELVAFIERAIGEAEKQSFWTGVNKPYEQAIVDYIDRLFADPSFLSDFAETMKPFWLAGALNSFSQTVLKLTTPGVPIIHSGAETWDLSVSPTSVSRSANFEKLRSQLVYADQSPLNLLLEDWYSGGVKQRIVKSYLHVRREMPQLFLDGDYVPLKAVGDQADHIVAFYRKFHEQYAVVAVPRLPFDMLKSFSRPLLPLPEWEDTFLQIPDLLVGKTLRHAMTDKVFTLERKFPLVEGLREFPVVTLVGQC